MASRSTATAPILRPADADLFYYHLVNRATCLVALIVWTTTGCLRSTTFTCEQSAECAGAGPQAECDLQAKVCTFADSSCMPSMRRYADNSGARSGDCVGGNGGDGGVDTPSGGGCPATFMALPNSGPRAHRYLLQDMQRQWAQQRDACAAAGGFLAYPDGTTLADASAELLAIKVLTGDGAWIGVNDLTTEGTYQTSLNQPVSAILRMLIVTGGGNPGQQDCFRIANTTLDDEDCQQTYKAACECIP